MNPLRRILHRTMEWSGLDRTIDANAVNARIERRRTRAHRILEAEEASAWIHSTLLARQPAAIAKLGSSECWAVAWHLRLRRFYKYTWTPPTFGELDLAEQSGVFPNTPESFHRFAKIYLDRLGALDGCAVWHNIGESQILAKHSPRVRRLALRSLEPYFFDQPWSKALAGKRVLVIHPFATSIRNQFARRAALWPERPDVLPDFELEIVRSPYGFSRNDFADWGAMLEWLEQQVLAVHRRKPIDVALIGCGAAGLPLATFVKSLGAIGIHTGGATQLLFGIRGGRWDTRREFQPFFNDAWIRPGPEETPPEAKKVDKGGYW